MLYLAWALKVAVRISIHGFWLIGNTCFSDCATICKKVSTSMVPSISSLWKRCLLMIALWRDHAKVGHHHFVDLSKIWYLETCILCRSTPPMCSLYWLLHFGCLTLSLQGILAKLFFGLDWTANKWFSIIVSYLQNCFCHYIKGYQQSGEVIMEETRNLEAGNLFLQDREL